MARAALKVFGVGGLLGVAIVVSISSASDGSCVEQKAACDLEEVCSRCAATGVINRNSREACSKHYPESETFCELLGASYCCIFDDEAETQQCVNDPTTAEYWGCILGENGCGIESLPCFDGGGEGGGRENSQESRSPSTSPGNVVQRRGVVQGGGSDSVGILAVAGAQDIQMGISTSLAPSVGRSRALRAPSPAPSTGPLKETSTMSSATGCGGTRLPARAISAEDTPSPTQSVRCIDIPTSYGHSSDSNTISDSSSSAVDDRDVIEDGTTSAPTATTEAGVAGSLTPPSSIGCGGTPAPAEALAAEETPSPTQSVRCIDIPTSHGYSSDTSISSFTSIIGEGPSTAPTSAPTVNAGAGEDASTPPSSIGCGGSPGPTEAIAAGQTFSPTRSVRCIDIPTTYGYSSSSSTESPTVAVATSEKNDRGITAGDTIAPISPAGVTVDPIAPAAETTAPTSGADGIGENDASDAATDGAETVAPPSGAVFAGTLGFLMASAMFM